MITFLKSILSGVLTDLIKDGVAWLKDYWMRKKRIDKADKQIKDERKEVNASVKDIIDTKARGEELNAEQIKRLKAANRKLSSGFFG